MIYRIYYDISHGPMVLYILENCILFVPIVFLQASKVNQELADGCINQELPAYLVLLAIEDLQGQQDHPDHQAVQVQTYKTY